MRVKNLTIRQTGTNTLFCADFIFSTPFGTKNERRLFRLKRVLQPLIDLPNFVHNGFSVRQKIWFTVPTLFANLSEYPDAFFIIAFALASVLHENLQFEGAISEGLIEQIPNMGSYYAFTKSDIHVSYKTKIKTQERTVGVAQFFTLGVDSFYTLLHKSAPLVKKANYLIFIQGFDVPLRKQEFLKTVRNRIRTIAAKTHTQAVFMETNVREISDRIVGWGQFHVCALAAAGTLLPFERILISGETFEANDWGLRFGADSLFSKPNLKFSLVAHNVPRDKKIESLIQSPQFNLFINNVRTCWLNVEEEHMPYNCTACQKCLRTVLTLQALGVKKTPTFQKLDLQKLRLIELNAHILPEWQTVMKLLQKRADTDPKLLEIIHEVLEKPLVIA